MLDILEESRPGIFGVVTITGSGLLHWLIEAAAGELKAVGADSPATASCRLGKALPGLAENLAAGAVLVCLEDRVGEDGSPCR